MMKEHVKLVDREDGPSPLLALLVVPLAFFVYALAWGEQYAGE